MKLSVIIVNYNVCKDVVKCISSIKKSVNGINYEIIVADNNSYECNISEIKELFPDVRLILLEQNKGFGFANNEAMKIAKGEYFLIVNPDIEFRNGTVYKLMEYLIDNPETGVVSPVLISPEGNVEFYDSFFPSFFSRVYQTFGGLQTKKNTSEKMFKSMRDNIEKGKPFKVDNVMGACMMLRKELFNSTGGFDEAFFLYEEETDWQRRIHYSGWDVKILPDIFVIHNHHSSIKRMGKDFEYYHFFRSRIIFSNKHYNYTKNLLFTLLFSLALLSRIIINLCRYTYKNNKYYFKKSSLQYELFKFNLRRRKDIINNIYNFDEHISSFPR